MRSWTAFFLLALLTAVLGGQRAARAQPAGTNPVRWSAVVNSGDDMPTDTCDPAAPGPTCLR